MESSSTMHGRLTDPKSITEHVMDDARRAFSNLSEDVLRGVVEAAVSDLCSESIKVTSFVPVLAMRLVRESIEHRSRQPMTVPETGT